jgi:hypothetical protein
MRVDLRDGQWAEVREHISHGAAKAILRANEDTDIWEFMTDLTRGYVKAWDIKDPDGQPIGVDDPQAVDKMPQDIVQALFRDTLRPLWRQEMDLAPTPPSSDGSESEPR